MVRFFGALVLTTFLAGSPAAVAQETEGLPVAVQVLDSNGAPIRNAWVRIPGTEGRRRVDSENGVWQASYLYTTSGEELIFKRGMVLEFTVTAPGYEPTTVAYKLRRARNAFTIALDRMMVEEITSDDEETLLMTWFGAEGEGGEEGTAPDGGAEGEAPEGGDEGEAPEGGDEEAGDEGEAPEGGDEEADDEGEAPEGGDEEAGDEGEAPEGGDEGEAPEGEEASEPEEAVPSGEE